MSTIIVYVLSCFVIALIVHLLNKKENKQSHFDERQLISRGNAYKYGFFSVIFYYIFYYVVISKYEVLSSASMWYLGIFLGVIVFAIYSILNDAFLRIHENALKRIAFIGVTGLLNISVGIAMIVKHGIIEEGKINSSFLNLEIGILFIAVVIAFWVKENRNKREE